MERFLTNSGLLELGFYYSESCNNVYKKFSVYLNNEKKDIRLARQLLKGFEENEPKILTAKCYFWSSGRNSKERRRNELIRYEEWNNFVEILKKENKYITLPYKLHENERYSVILRENDDIIEKYEIVVINKRMGKEIYHYYLKSIYFDNYDYEKLIEDAKKQRIKQVANARINHRLKINLLEIAKKVYVNEEDSVKSGNCATQTNLYAKKIRSMFSVPIKAVRGDFLLKLRDDEFTRRAILYKARQLNLI